MSGGRRCLAAIGACAVALIAFGARAATVVDARGQSLTLAQPAARIVSLAPFITELLFDAGAGGRVVGVSRYSEYPAAARALPVVGDAVRLDLERIVALRPDLVVAWGSGTPGAAVARLRSVGLPVFVLEPHRLLDIPLALRDLGRLAGTSSVAERAAHRFERDVVALRARYSRRAPVPTFIEIASQPLLTLNDSHLVSDVLRLCGGRNVFGDLPMLVANVGWEDLVQANPDAIFITSEDAQAALVAVRRYPVIRAVVRNHLFVLAPDTIVQQTPRVLQGARAMCEALDRVRGGG